MEDDWRLLRGVGERREHAEPGGPAAGGLHDIKLSHKNGSTERSCPPKDPCLQGFRGISGSLGRVLIAKLCRITPPPNQFPSIRYLVV